MQKFGNVYLLKALERIFENHPLYFETYVGGVTKNYFTKGHFSLIVLKIT